MTLEEKVLQLWQKEDPGLDRISLWEKGFAEDDFTMKSFSGGPIELATGAILIRGTEKIISSNLAEGLISSNPYIRRYAQLLSGEDNVS